MKDLVNKILRGVYPEFNQSTQNDKYGLAEKNTTIYIFFLNWLLDKRFDREFSAKRLKAKKYKRLHF
jgi:hypothetical protein